MKRSRDPKVPCQLTMSLDNRAMEGLEAVERAEVVRLFAQLLLEACGIASEEDGDEDV